VRYKILFLDLPDDSDYTLDKKVKKNEASHCNNFEIEKYPTSTLTSELKNALAYMENEERLAYRKD